MSIYSALKFPVPVMAYCALHQVKKGKDPEEYRKTMKDLHRLLREQTESINNLWEAYRAEAGERAAQTAGRLLSPFLTTPLKSDVGEIRQILKDQMREYALQIAPGHRYGVVRAGEAKILVDYPAAGLTKKLLASGISYLKELQFQTGNSAEEMYESSFVIEGGMNFDVIEHLVRDRIGIYTPVHGKHITEFDAYGYTAYNRIYFSEFNPAGAGYEASLYCSKGSTRYDPFRNALSALLAGFGSLEGVLSVSAWQRKLGLGVGREFLVRVMLKGTETVPGVVQSIAAHKEKPFLKEALLGGHLLVKEFIV